MEITMAVKGLKKIIGRKEIIKGIDFEVRKGEVFGFLGPNGAGKTTTIRMLVGLIRPSAGEVEICGYNLSTHFPEAMRHLGCIVENPELYPYLTGWENLQLFARMVPGITESRLTEVAELVGLDKRIHDKVKTYSLGMRQRLGIAQALLGKPKILILDEPTNGLDPAGIREMREFIRFLAGEGLSVFVSSHLLSEIQLMCDRVAIISKGTIKRVDTVENLLAERERLVWRVHPLEKAREVLSEFTEVHLGEDQTLWTPYLADQVTRWNKKLNSENVDIFEMRRQSPTLEDLYLELTGGETID
ncbi:ABC transporter ATP-binding protein [Collibacillus ludicampi]|uniref:ABC transporter ATP-binding protein n=1 Tax=Collibacillus ludicampi TaxID=2771369 RepID=A0AAV4LB73_9BACL|nr:ABC transporter ATP-binding protein [Collibacillus ludicampi]